MTDSRHRVCKSYRDVIVKAGRGSLSIAWRSHLFTWIIFFVWKLVQLGNIKKRFLSAHFLMLHWPPTLQFLAWCNRCKWSGHAIQNNFEMNVNSGSSTGALIRRQRHVIRLCSSLLWWWKGYTPPPPGRASLSRRCCMASSLLPQTASWCCLSSWHESACRWGQLSQQHPPLAYISGSVRFMRYLKGSFNPWWVCSIKADLV